MAFDDSLGKLSSKQGPPVEVAWRWYYGVPSVPLWILLGLLLIAPPRNRRWQAWWIVLPPLVVSGLGAFFYLATGPSDGLETLFYFLTTLSIAWAAVWLLAPWLAARRRVVRAIVVWFVMLVVGVVGYLGYYQFTLSGDAAEMWVMMWCVASAALVVGTSAAGACWRGQRPMYVFMLWLVLWMPVVCLVGMIVFGIVAAIVTRGVDILAAMLCSSVVASLMISTCLYVLNAPVMAFARFCPFYRERFGLLFGPLEPPDETGWPAELPQPVTAELATPADEPGGDCPFAPTNSP